MIEADEDALICDLAETYHIHDYRRLPLTTVASFAIGLRDNSRIKMKLQGAKATTDTILAAAMVDRLTLLLWAQTKDASKGRNRPKSILEDLMTPKQRPSVYASGKDFNEARKRLLLQIEGG